MALPEPDIKDLQLRTNLEALDRDRRGVQSEMRRRVTATETDIAAAEAAITTLQGKDNNSAYKFVNSGQGPAATLPTGTYFLAYNGFYASGSATTGAAVPIGFDFASGDFTVASLTTRFRVKMAVFTGGTSPSTVVLTAGLYPVTVSGGNYTLGTVVTGSTAASTGLTTNSTKRFNSGDFAASALSTDPGFYCLGVAVTSITVPAGIAVHLALQNRHT